MDVEFLVIIAIWEIVSLCFLIDLWKRKIKVFNKILFSLVLIVPFLGPIIFVCIIDSPPDGPDYHPSNLPGC